MEKPLWQMPFDQKNQISTITTSSAILGLWGDEKQIFAACGDGTIHIWDRQTHNPIAVWKNQDDSIKSIWGDSNFIYGGSIKGNIYVWDRKSGELMDTWGAETPYILSLWGDQSKLYSGSKDHNRSILIWDRQSGDIIDEWNNHKNNVYCIQGDESHLYSGGQDGCIRIWDRENGSQIKRTGSNQNKPVYAIWLNSKIIVLGLKNGNLNILKKQTGEYVGSIRGHNGDILALWGDKKYLYVGNHESVFVWNHLNWECEARWDCGACCFWGDSKLLYAACNDKLTIWNIQQGDEQIDNKKNEGKIIPSKKCSPDNKTCIYCEKSFPKDEMICCFECGNYICKECECSDTVLSCDGCNKPLCDDCAQKHDSCYECGVWYCNDCLENSDVSMLECEYCEDSFCVDHGRCCSLCGTNVCLDCESKHHCENDEDESHEDYCGHCGKLVKPDEDGSFLCCGYCEETLCEMHYGGQCEECGEELCVDCLACCTECKEKMIKDVICKQCGDNILCGKCEEKKTMKSSQKKNESSKGEDIDPFQIHILSPKEIEKLKNTPQKIVLTGDWHILRNDLMNILKNQGHSVTSKVSGQTTLVLCNDKKSRTVKIKEAIKNNLPILTYAEFLPECNKE